MLKSARVSYFLLEWTGISMLAATSLSSTRGKKASMSGLATGLAICSCEGCVYGHRLPVVASYVCLASLQAGQFG